jgi:hypothetical protein
MPYAPRTATGTNNNNNNNNNTGIHFYISVHTSGVLKMETAENWSSGDTEGGYAI